MGVSNSSNYMYSYLKLKDGRDISVNPCRSALPQISALYGRSNCAQLLFTVLKYSTIL